MYIKPRLIPVIPLLLLNLGGWLFVSFFLLSAAPQTVGKKKKRESKKERRQEGKGERGKKEGKKKGKKDKKNQKIGRSRP
jgi:hypothetical protein